MTISAANFDTPFEALLDRTAALVPKYETFTAGGTWTKAANAMWVLFTVVGGGGAGGDRYVYSNAGHGGGGGSSGMIVQRAFAASLLPATMTVTVGAAGALSSVAGGSGELVRALAGVDGGDAQDYGIEFVGGGRGGISAGAGSAVGGHGGRVMFPDPHELIADSAAGTDGRFTFAYVVPSTTAGDGVAGGDGWLAAGGAGGLQSAPGGDGDGGLGYGAGGGGGGGGDQIAADYGGGGGGSGYGTSALASAGSAGVGGAGAAGIVLVTTWRGVAL